MLHRQSAREVVFATETLALGINMPARTVVIERLTKIREHGRSGLSVGGVRADDRAGRTARARLGRPRRGACGRRRCQIADGGRAGDVARPGSAVVVPADLQPGRQPGAPLPRRPGPRHARPVLRPVPRHATTTTRCRAASIGPCALLERLGYVDLGAWRLTDARRPPRPGSTTSAICSSPRRWPTGSSTDSTPPELAAVVSACTFETRPGRDRRSASVRRRRCARGSRDLGDWPSGCAPRSETSQSAAHAPARRRVRRGGAGAGRRGERLDHVLERAELAPGDFVRNAKQLIDLLRQLAVLGTPGHRRGGPTRRRRPAARRGGRGGGPVPVPTPPPDPLQTAPDPAGSGAPAGPGPGAAGGVPGAPGRRRRRGPPPRPARRS